MNGALSVLRCVQQAFAPKSGRKALGMGLRKAEKDQTKLHVPLVDRTPKGNPPPVVVAIVGPPGVRSCGPPQTKSLVAEPVREI